MLNILTLSGSPVRESSTEILLGQIALGIAESSETKVRDELIRLNDIEFRACQSCGESPEPDWCLFRDNIYPVFDKLINCDVILFGSPVYFDTVSAQAKLFIDRCNCLRPPDFGTGSQSHFKKVLPKKRLGAIVLVGGERGKFECARTVLAGFLKWVRVGNCGTITYAGKKWREVGPVKDDREKMEEAFKLGRKISQKLSID
jgi:multimeric flavodoxin WrbA